MVNKIARLTNDKENHLTPSGLQSVDLVRLRC
jgi:hypothetical protein